MFDILTKEPIILYSDGSSSNNKTRCTGWGTILKYKNHYREYWGGFEPDTTNQQTELYSVLFGLSQLKTNDIPVKIHSDSAYLINSMNKDLVNKMWRMNGWMTTRSEPVANRALWEEIEKVAKKQFYIEWIKVKGHSDIELNERADKLAVKGRHNIEVRLGLRDSKESDECTCKQCRDTVTDSVPVYDKWKIF